MASIEVVPREGEQRRATPVVNDFSIQVATVNGSGSQSANTVLLRAIFQMGVPVSGKNLFPSNIAGLPTWYTIRASKHGYIARKKEVDFLVAMNPESAREDVLSLASGSAVLYDEPLHLSQLRGDLTYYAVPFDKLTAAVCPDAKLRKLVKNMVYVGVAAWLLSLEMPEVEKAIRRQFASKAKAAELNWSAAKAGYDYAASSLTKADPFRVERMHATAGKIIVDGNAAAALGAMFGGVTVVTWYPITPSSSLVEQLIDAMREHRVEADGRASFAIVQAEDELAAIGMVVGASWAGARAMTATSGPGISLMSEFAGLAYYAEIPAVVWDVQRIGPSTGLPTRTAQGDLLAVASLSHGDTRHVMLFPASVAECFSMGVEAFDFAEQLQTPVFVMSDLDLAMNNWMSDPFPYPEKPMQRGKVLSREELQRLGGFQRYKDIDGDGITYRTLPGTDHPAAAWFARGSGHNEAGQYSERPDDYVRNMDRLVRKFENARAQLPAPEILESPQQAQTRRLPGAPPVESSAATVSVTGTAASGLAILAYGTSHWAAVESLRQLEREHQMSFDYLRVRAYPFAEEIRQFIARHRRVYVVDQNRDGQMLQLLKLDLPAEEIAKLRSVRHYTGLPVDARSITDAIVSQEESQNGESTQFAA